MGTMIFSLANQNKMAECLEKRAKGECRLGEPKCEKCDLFVDGYERDSFERNVKEMCENISSRISIIPKPYVSYSYTGKRPHWIIYDEGYYPYCSNCGAEPEGRVMTKYCPNCGAFMVNSKIPESYIQKRLAEYEKTGLTPEKIIAIKAENERLHQLVDFFENVVGEGTHNDR